MIVILTALPVEYAAVRDHLIDVQKHRHRVGTLFEVGQLAEGPDRTIALAGIGKGNLTAATLTERAIEEFRPTTMMFVGVAGGLRDWLQLGDVVVATRVHAYHGGRSEDDEFLVRPRSWEISHAIEQAAQMVARGDEWHGLLPRRGKAVRPKVYFDPIAAGDVVLNSRESTQAQRIRRNYNDAIAVEMESSGFASASHLNGNVPMASMRGISDFADGRKEATDREGWQSIAARNAAAFAVSLATTLDDTDEDASESGITRESGPQNQNTNIARDKSNVNQQINTNHGDNYFGSPSIGEDK